MNTLDRPMRSLTLTWLAEKPVCLGEKTYLCAWLTMPGCSVISTRRQQLQQFIALVAVVFCGFPCFPKASCVGDALQGGEGAANEVFRFLHHPLESPLLCSRASVVPGSHATIKDAHGGGPIEVSLYVS